MLVLSLPGDTGSLNSTLSLLLLLAQAPAVVAVPPAAVALHAHGGYRLHGAALLCLTCLEPQPGLESHYSLPGNSSPARLQSRAGSHGRAEQDNRKHGDKREKKEQGKSCSGSVLSSWLPAV